MQVIMNERVTTPGKMQQRCLESTTGKVLKSVSKASKREGGAKQLKRTVYRT